jgi:methionine-rich copper-binding protein CopC
MNRKSAFASTAHHGLAHVSVVLALVAATWWPGTAHAQPMSALDSFPVVNQVMDRSATSFAIRFDGPIDHARSRLTLVTPLGVRALRARLNSRPNTLFSAVGALAPGNYQLQWEVMAMNGTISRGSIPFSVSPR